MEFWFVVFEQININQNSFETTKLKAEILETRLLKLTIKLS